MDESRPKIFISAVSKELASAREKIADVLRLLQFHPVCQQEVLNHTGIVRAILETELAPCTAVIVLIFYTAKARVSKFIQQTELPVSLDRSDAGECTVLWVPLERNDLLDEHPLEKRLKALQCATRDVLPIFDFDHPHKA